jgi:hypothetical protein
MMIAGLALAMLVLLLVDDDGGRDRTRVLGKRLK